MLTSFLPGMRLSANSEAAFDYFCCGLGVGGFLASGSLSG
jgi:hypothetical protein